MILLWLIPLAGGLAFGYAAGAAHTAMRIPRIIARSTPIQRQALLARASKHR